MDVTSSVITIVSSVVTLAVRSQQLIGNYGTLDGKIENLERKARSFAYVVEQVRDAYAPEGSQGLPLDPEVCARLADCEGQLKRFETEVAKLMRQRKKGKHGAGFVLGTWQEKVARPVFELVEDAIATHQNDLQALLVKHHGHQLDQNQKSLQRIQAILEQVFDKIETLGGSQSLLGPAAATDGGISPLQRTFTDATIPNASENPDGDAGLYQLATEDEGPSSLHQLAQGFLRALMTSVMSNKGAAFSPGSASNTSVPSGSEWNALWEAAKSKEFDRSPSPLSDQGAFPPPLRKPSPSDGHPSGFSFSQVSESAFQDGLRKASASSRSNGRLTRSDSETFARLAQAQTNSSDYAVTEASSGESMDVCEVTSRPFDDRSASRRDSAEGQLLLEAVQKGTPQEVEAHLSSNASLEERDDKDRTPLMLAASSGYEDKVKTLLSYGARTRSVDQEGATALHLAVREGHNDVVSLLLKQKDGPLQANMPDKKGRTPLHYRTFYPTSEDIMLQVVKCLLARGADPNIKDGSATAKPNYRFPPIYYAIKSRKFQVVHCFLTQGVSLDFNRPETSPEIHDLLDDYRELGSLPLLSPSGSRKSTPSRKDSIKSEKEPKTRRVSSFGRKRSAA